MDQFDGQLVMNGKKRGLSQLLLRLATGPSLIGILGGNGDSPHPVSKNLSWQYVVRQPRLFWSHCMIVFIGGAYSVWIYSLLLGCASRCDEYEFGVNGIDYSRRGRGATSIGGRTGGWQAFTYLSQ